jgi:pimeloyl-ACP methyl ester carboxylesterase
MAVTTARSRDGTPIAYERAGHGVPVVLVGGGLDDGSENEPIAAELAATFTTYNYARRGRGASGDTPPYAVAREIEDIAALIAVEDRPVHLFGVSSGGMLALEATAAGLPIERVAVYEVPYDRSLDAEERFDGYRAMLDAALREGRRGDAVELFMRVAGAGDDAIADARLSPVWPQLEALAHTLAYDAAMYGPPPNARLAGITRPVLVATGGSDPFFEASADAITTAIPSAQRVVLEGQGHVADASAVARVLNQFFDDHEDSQD